MVNFDDKIEQILEKVQKAPRYTGGEEAHSQKDDNT